MPYLSNVSSSVKNQIYKHTVMKQKKNGSQLTGSQNLGKIPVEPRWAQPKTDEKFYARVVIESEV